MTPRKRSEEQPRTILESITDAFFAVSSDWRFTYVNPQAGRVLDRPPEELIGKSLWEEYPGVRGSVFEPVYRRAANERVAGEITAFYPDHNRWYEVHVYPAPDGISIYFRDVTESKQGEAALRQSEARFRQLADAMPQIVWAAGPDGTLDYYNRRWFEYIDLPAEAFEQARWDRYIHPDDLQRAYDAWGEALRSGKPYGIEFRVRRADGQYRWFLVRALPIRDADGRITRWFGTCTDIEDQKQTEAALRLSREQMEIVVKGANVGVWYCPLPFDKLIWDEKVKEHFHLAADAEVTIDTFYERLHPDDRERTKKAIDISIGLRKPYDIDYRTVSPDGQSVKWIRAGGRGFYDPAGSPTRFDGITLDVTERVRVEQALEDARRRLGAAVAGAQIATFVWEIQSDVIFADVNMSVFFKLPVDGGMGLPISAYIGTLHPEDRLGVKSLLNRAVETGDDYIAEYRVAGHDPPRWAYARARVEHDADGRAARMAGVVIDISDRKRSEVEARTPPRKRTRRARRGRAGQPDEG